MLRFTWQVHWPTVHQGQKFCVKFFIQYYIIDIFLPMPSCFLRQTIDANGMDSLGMATICLSLKYFKCPWSNVHHFNWNCKKVINHKSIYTVKNYDMITEKTSKNNCTFRYSGRQFEFEILETAIVFFSKPIVTSVLCVFWLNYIFYRELLNNSFLRKFFLR